MEVFWEIFLNALIASAAGSIITLVIIFIKWMAKTNKLLIKLANDTDERKNEIKTIIYILKRLIIGNQATLIAIKEGRINGEVTSALGKIKEADDAYEDLFLDKVQDNNEQVS